jgi:hypothetical protein
MIELIPKPKIKSRYSYHLTHYSFTKDYGYISGQVPQEILNELKETIDNLQNNFEDGIKYNDNLVGEIEHEYETEIGDKFKNYIKHAVSEYEKRTTGKANDSKRYNLSDPWVNFQKKYEYNPLHRHEGSFSWVLWYKIPYTFNDEIKYTHKSNKDNLLHGDFTFHYPMLNENKNDNAKIIVGCTPLKIDKSKEGMFALFPSSLHHSVNPFYSTDDYRITIAGNINIK